MKTGAELITDERKRQIEVKGFTNDSKYTQDELVEYAKFLLTGSKYYFPTGWDKKWFDKRFTRSRKENLIKAGALIAAELDLMIKEEK